MRQVIVLLFFCVGIGSASQCAQAPGASKPPGSDDKNSLLAREVQHQLLTLPYCSVFDNIGFSLEGKKVTLYGQVVRSSLKKNAEAEIKSLEGIDVVVNRIEVLPASPGDDDLRRSIYRSIFEDSALSRYAVDALPSIRIIVRNGDVSLEGSVLTVADRNLAATRTSSVANVRNLRNNLVVRAKAGERE